MCLALGQPLMLDAADHSCTQRPRAYWTHMRLHPAIEPVTQGFDPMNPNQYNVILPGHTAELYVVDVKTAAYTIGASWIGEPERPCADTSVPVLVHNIRFLVRFGAPPHHALLSQQASHSPASEDSCP